MGDGVTGVTRQKAEHEGNPLAGLTKRIRSKGMRDETGPGTSKGKGSVGLRTTAAALTFCALASSVEEARRASVHLCLESKFLTTSRNAGILYGSLWKPNEAGGLVTQHITHRNTAPAQFSKHLVARLPQHDGADPQSGL